MYRYTQIYKGPVHAVMMCLWWAHHSQFLISLQYNHHDSRLHKTSRQVWDPRLQKHLITACVVITYVKGSFEVQAYLFVVDIWHSRFVLNINSLLAIDWHSSSVILLKWSVQTKGLQLIFMALFQWLKIDAKKWLKSIFRFPLKLHVSFIGGWGGQGM